MALTMSFGVQVAAILVGSFISTLLAGALSWCCGRYLGRRRQGELARDIEMGVRAALESANDGQASRETAPAGGWLQALFRRSRGKPGQVEEQPPDPSQQGPQ